LGASKPQNTVRIILNYNLWHNLARRVEAWCGAFAVLAVGSG
jgi:hypothetical protein